MNTITNRTRTPVRTPIVLALCAAATASLAVAAEETSARRSVADRMLEEVVVTATKKSDGEALQTAALAVSAFGSDQLDLLQVRGIGDLSYTVPNIQLEDVGTQKGTANFSIRGMGINVSVPSLDPAVGVFIDGVYMGTAFGVVTDQFDMDTIEVLRGPQGLLFGKNVTGGAVQINTKDPTPEFEGYVRTAVETGLNTYVMGAVSGPLIEDRLLGRLALYNNNDQGYFKNRFDGSDVGESDTQIARLGLTFLPTETSELTIKYERASIDGDGTPSQNWALYKPGSSHDVTIDYPGFIDTEWDFISADFQMDLGAGTLTNILGWKETELGAGFDADGTGGNAFHTTYAMKFEQFSEELRYNVTLQDWVDVTTGLYYFTQDMVSVEDRLVGGASFRAGGGEQEQETLGAYLSLDWQLTDTVTLNTGIRYTTEEKDVSVASLTTTNAAFCSVATRSCSQWNFVDDEKWAGWTPKVGVQWFINPDTQLYGFYTRGFRSGGYNLRYDATGSPGPMDEETQDSFEIGLKSDLFDSRLRLNAAVFYNDYSDLQRSVLQASLTGGTATNTANTADATIQGVEFEATAVLTDNLILTANLGIMEGSYDEVRFDISGDGVVNDVDKNLDIPRLAELSGGVALTWEDYVFGDYSLLARVGYSYRDDYASSDNNAGVVPSADLVNATLALTIPGERMKFSLYVKNLTDEVVYGSVAPLPLSPLFGYSGGRLPTVTQMGKGRVFGAEFIYNF